MIMTHKAKGKFQPKYKDLL